MARRFVAPVRVAVGAALALAGLALLANPASAAVKSTMTTVTESSGARTGAPVTFTATVVHGALVPTGTVTFTVTGTSSTPYTCDSGNVSSLQPNGSGPGAVATCTFTAGLQASDSPYAVSASYSGDPNFSGSTGNLSATIHLGNTTTTLNSASNPSVTGQPVTFTATVAPQSPASGTPTGSVTFSINGTGGGSVACDGGDTVPLSGNTASCSIGAGLLAQFSPYTVSGTYSGDTNFATSTGSVNQTVAKQSATISVVSSVPGLLLGGQAVTFTATVTPSGPPPPTGSVVFSVVGSGGTTATCDGGDTQPLSGSSATCSFAAGLLARPDFYTVTATLKDPNFNTPVAGSLVQEMQKADTSTSVSGVPTHVIAGQTFGFTITIQTQAPGSGVPQGNIEWAVCSVNAPSCSGSNAPAGGTFALPTPTKKDIANNEQLLKFSVPGGIAPPGLYSVSATFWGAADFQSSTSTDSNMLVEKVPTSMSLFLSSNPVRSGDRLVIRVGIIGSTLASPSIGAPTGQVTFSIVGASNDSLTCDTGSNVMTISTNNQNQGFASCDIPNGVISEGDAPYEVQASYSGDSIYDSVNASQSVHVIFPH